MWRAFAWPLGTVLVAAGLGILPAPLTLPAGTGGLIGIAAAGLSAHAATCLWPALDRHRLPLLLLLAGLPLAFLATGLRVAAGLARAWQMFPLRFLLGRLTLLHLRDARASQAGRL